VSIACRLAARITTKLRARALDLHAQASLAEQLEREVSLRRAARDAEVLADLIGEANREIAEELRAEAPPRIK